MKNNDLIERYIYACTKSISKRSRDDVAKELETLICDMLDERCGEITPTEKDLMVVLTEIGQPYEIAEKYDLNAEKSLIGPPYYSKYVFVLKMVIISIVFGITVAHLVMSITEPQQWYFALFDWATSLVTSLFIGFGFVTLTFAIFQRKGIDAISLSANTLTDLPSVPKKNEVISKGESIVGIVFAVVFTVVFLVVPGAFCAIVDGKTIPIFNMEYLQSTWYIIILFAAMCIISESINLIDGRYTKRVMFSTIITDCISAVLAIAWLSNSAILNHEFVEIFPQILGKENTVAIYMFENFNIGLLGIILFALALECGVTIYRTLKAKA